ncbi:MAG: twin-arginine translocation signal domain-containing protein [Sedimentisphaerales bacterium]|nr:twin-arginine translocation signal domain-containing protein [Sedimentisphaerales bacterium]
MAVKRRSFLKKVTAGVLVLAGQGRLAIKKIVPERITRASKAGFPGIVVPLNEKEVKETGIWRG